MNKHLKLFANHTAYEAAKNNIDKPNVVMCQQENEVHFNPTPSLIYIKRQGPTVAGYINGNTCFIYTNNNLCYIFNFETGEVQTNGPLLNDAFKNSVIDWASDAGFIVSQVDPKEESLEIGQSMQNWNNYVII